MRNHKFNFGVKTLKGVSTLESINKIRLIAMALFLTASILGGGYGVIAGHSTLDTVDPTFNALISTGQYRSKQIGAIATLPDGKILVGGGFGGSFNSYNGVETGSLVRLTPDGALDNTFNNNTINSTVEQRVHAIVPLPSGKILVGGFFSVNGETATRSLVRLNADGSLDTSFNCDAAADSVVQQMEVRPNGKIVIGGTLRFAQNGNAVRKIVQLNEDGSFDASFNSGLNVPNFISIALQGDKLIVGVVSSVGTDGSVSRLNADGSLDASFNNRNNADVVQIVVQPDNKILHLSRNRLARLNENGSDDGSFQPVAYQTTRRIMLQENGKIVVVHGTTFIERLLPSGVRDTTFNPYQYGFVFSAFAAQSGERLIVGENLAGFNGTTPVNGFLRLNSDGSRDTSFNQGGIGFQNVAPGAVRGIAVQPDNKIIIAGRFDVINNVGRYRIARLNVDGSLDNSFQISTTGTNSFIQIGEIYNVALQPDGKIIVSGVFDYRFNGATKSSLVRLNADGSIDPTFNIFGVIPNSAGATDSGSNKVVVRADGRIWVGTTRQTITQSTVPLRLNSDGSRDDSFNSVFRAEANYISIFDFAVQPDGKIVIGGKYHVSGQGINRSFVARLNADGSADSSFQTLEENVKTVRSLALLPNGKFLVGQTINPIFPATYEPGEVVRLNADGSPDATFNSGAGANARINVLLPLSTGKILVGGRFTQFNNQPRQYLALLNADGSLSQTLINVNQEVLSLTLDNQGRVLIGGAFTTINAGGANVTRTYIARITDSPQSSNVRPRFDFDGDRRSDLAVFNPSNGVWTIRKSGNNQTITTQFGRTGDITAPADFDGDGTSDIAVYRPSEGIWYLLRSTAGFAAVRWGAPEDKPVPADYDGDGKADVAVWRPSNGMWFVLQSSNNEIRAVHFGQAGDVILRDADFDGDRKADIAVWRPSNGVWYWLASNKNNQFMTMQFGQTGDIIAPADFNADGKTDIAVFRPENGTWYQQLSNPNGIYTFSARQFGISGDVPVAADYNGDGSVDIAVKRGDAWHLLLSTQGYSGAIFGTAAEQPVAAQP